MALVIETLLRGANLTQPQRLICLKGIAQMAMADGVEDPRERAYLKKFVDEFFEGADPTDGSLSEPLTAKDLEVLDSKESKECFTAYLYLTAHIDEDFSDEEKKFAKELIKDLVGPERDQEIIVAVREFLYRRSVFSYAFRYGRLDEAFSLAMAKKFDIDHEQARQINIAVFNAIMAMKGPVAQQQIEENP